MLMRRPFSFRIRITGTTNSMSARQMRSVPGSARAIVSVRLRQNDRAMTSSGTSTAGIISGWVWTLLSSCSSVDGGAVADRQPTGGLRRLGTCQGDHLHRRLVAVARAGTWKYRRRQTGQAHGWDSSFGGHHTTIRNGGSIRSSSAGLKPA